jgi:hypothetical protein
MVKVIWKVYVKGVCIGTAHTEDRVKLIKESVASGKIDSKYEVADLKFEVVGTEDVD